MQNKKSERRKLKGHQRLRCHHQSLKSPVCVGSIVNFEKLPESSIELEIKKGEKGFDCILNPKPCSVVGH